jgi:hypothetical protein
VAALALVILEALEVEIPKDKVSSWVGVPPTELGISGPIVHSPWD